MMMRNRYPLGALWQELNQAQDEFTKWFGRAARGPAAPAFNVWEDDQAVHAEADLPGVDPARLEVMVTEGNQLTVQGERPAPLIKGAVWLRQERPFGKFVREITLPSLVDASRVEAKYTNGVLHLTMPKHEAAKPRKITVKGD